MKKLTALLLVALMLLSFAACGGNTTATQGAYRSKTQDAADTSTEEALQPTNKPEPNETDKSYAKDEPSEAIYNKEISWISYTAEGSFSEGRAFVHCYADARIDSDAMLPAYINEAGIIVLQLDGGETTYGYEYNEGYAVIADTSLYRPTNCALIDMDGHYVVRPGEYDWISSVRNGKYLWFNKIEDYTGTHYEMGINDVLTHQTQNAISFTSKFPTWPYEPDLVRINNNRVLFFIKYTYSPGWDLYLYSVDFEDGTIESYKCKYQRPSWDSGLYNEASELNRILDNEIMINFEYTMNGDYQEFIDISNNTILFSGDTNRKFYDRTVATNGYIIAQRRNPSGEVRIIDKSGETITEQTIEGLHYVNNVDDNLWIAEFHNNYYGVLTIDMENGKPVIKLAFDPIQIESEGHFYYIGQGLFFNDVTLELYDLNGFTGKKVDKAPEYTKYRVYLHYKNGYCILGSSRYSKLYVDKDGQVIDKAGLVR